MAAWADAATIRTVLVFCLVGMIAAIAMKDVGVVQSLVDSVRSFNPLRSPPQSRSPTRAPTPARTPTTGRPSPAPTASPEPKGAYLYPAEIQMIADQSSDPVKCHRGPNRRHRHAKGQPQPVSHGAPRATALESALGHQCGCITGLLPEPPSPYPWHSVELVESMVARFGANATNNSQDLVEQDEARLHNRGLSKNQRSASSHQQIPHVVASKQRSGRDIEGDNNTYR